MHLQVGESDDIALPIIFVALCHNLFSWEADDLIPGTVTFSPVSMTWVDSKAREENGYRCLTAPTPFYFYSIAAATTSRCERTTVKTVS